MKMKHPMSSSPAERTVEAKLQPVSTPSLATVANFNAIEKHASVIDRWRADRSASREAGHSLADLKTQRILAETRIATTGLKIAEAQIKTALVSGSMMQIGALTTDLNAKTAAVEQRLTTASQGEIIAHLQNRAASVSAIRSMEQDGRIASDEASALVSYAEADAVEDIHRSRERTRKAKEAVETLHGFALQGIATAKDSLT